MRKPVVGICADRRMLGAHPFHLVGEKYITAIVEGAGAFAILLPSLGELQDIDHTLSLVDGLLFTGSPSMVHPQHYQGPDLEPGTLLDAHRDATTLPLILTVPAVWSKSAGTAGRALVGQMKMSCFSIIGPKLSYIPAMTSRLWTKSIAFDSRPSSANFRA